MGIESSAGCILEIDFTLKSGKRREFNRSLEDLRSLEGEGHIRTTVFEDREEPGHILWVADWTNKTKLEEYLRSDGFGVLLGGLRVLGNLTRCRVVDDAGVLSLRDAEPVSRDRLPRQTQSSGVELNPADKGLH